LVPRGVPEAPRGAPAGPPGTPWNPGSTAFWRRETPVPLRPAAGRWTARARRP